MLSLRSFGPQTARPSRTITHCYVRGNVRLGLGDLLLAADVAGLELLG